MLVRKEEYSKVQEANKVLNEFFSTISEEDYEYLESVSTYIKEHPNMIKVIDTIIVIDPDDTDLFELVEYLEKNLKRSSDQP